MFELCEYHDDEQDRYCRPEEDHLYTEKIHHGCIVLLKGITL